MIPIMEIFYSIQGEVARTGVPSVFIRTGLCNLKCSGFKVEYPDPKDPLNVKYGCDSFYSVDSGFSKEWAFYENYEEVVDRVDKCLPTLSRHNLMKPDIIFTGGEPLIHWKNEQYQRLISHYITRGHKVTIETNASLPITFSKKYQNDIMFSMSVKLSNSGEEEQKRINIENITNILENTKNSYLKFVVNSEEWDKTYGEIKKILKSVPVYIENVYLMPMGDVIHRLEANAKFVFEKCMELGFHYSDRLHIRIFDNKPGV